MISYESSKSTFVSPFDLFFRRLISYHIFWKKNPFEIIKSSNSTIWKNLAADAHEHGVASLPNPETFNTWYVFFRTFRRRKVSCRLEAIEEEMEISFKRSQNVLPMNERPSTVMFDTLLNLVLSEDKENNNNNNNNILVNKSKRSSSSSSSSTSSLIGYENEKENEKKKTIAVIEIPSYNNSTIPKNILSILPKNNNTTQIIKKKNNTTQIIKKNNNNTQIITKKNNTTQIIKKKNNVEKGLLSSSSNSIKKKKINNHSLKKNDQQDLFSNCSNSSSNSSRSSICESQQNLSEIDESPEISVMAGASDEEYENSDEDEETVRDSNDFLETSSTHSSKSSKNQVSQFLKEKTISARNSRSNSGKGKKTISDFTPSPPGHSSAGLKRKKSYDSPTRKNSILRGKRINNGGISPSQNKEERSIQRSSSEITPKAATDDADCAIQSSNGRPLMPPPTNWARLRTPPSNNRSPHIAADWLSAANKITSPREIKNSSVGKSSAIKVSRAIKGNSANSMHKVLETPLSTRSIGISPVQSVRKSKAVALASICASRNRHLQSEVAISRSPLVHGRSPSTISVISSGSRTDEFEIIKLMTAGGQAAIFLARLPLDRNSLVVVKAFYSKPSQHELQSMSVVSLCSYSIRLIGTSKISKGALIPFARDLKNVGVDFESFQFENDAVMGFCYERLQGDLEQALLDRKRPINNTMKQVIALQIAYFLRGVHKSGFIFRDLKPSNILLNSAIHGTDLERAITFFLDHFPVIKVTDFGLVAPASQARKTRSAGTVGYMPSIQMHTNSYDLKVDIHAYAITLTELLVGQLVYDSSFPESEVEEEMRTFKVIERVKRMFATCQRYIPQTLRTTIFDALLGKLESIEKFIEYFESSLKHVAFALDLTKSSMNLLRVGVGTPLRSTTTGSGDLTTSEISRPISSRHF